MFNPGHRPEAFGLKLSEFAISQMISKVGQTQIIGQAELLPVFVSKLVWERVISNRRVIYFLDNDSARIALIRGYSPVLSSLDIIIKCARLDAVTRSSPWYTRVHTSSNPADEPSRLKKDQLVATFGAKIVRPSIDSLEGWFTDVLE